VAALGDYIPSSSNDQQQENSNNSDPGDDHIAHQILNLNVRDELWSSMKQEVFIDVSSAGEKKRAGAQGEG
jgi:hypothetical protein